MGTGSLEVPRRRMPRRRSRIPLFALGFVHDMQAVAADMGLEIRSGVELGRVELFEGDLAGPPRTWRRRCASERRRDRSSDRETSSNSRECLQRRRRSGARCCEQGTRRSNSSRCDRHSRKIDKSCHPGRTWSTVGIASAVGGGGKPQLPRSHVVGASPACTRSHTSASVATWPNAGCSVALSQVRRTLRRAS